jgi:biotin-(acetyl-CoA carboxylase) ligase
VELSVGFQQYGGGVEKWEQAERRSDLKEEASDLERHVVAAKTQESARGRESGTKWNFH